MPSPTAYGMAGWWYTANVAFSDGGLS